MIGRQQVAGCMETEMASPDEDTPYTTRGRAVFLDQMMVWLQPRARTQPRYDKSRHETTSSYLSTDGELISHVFLAVKSLDDELGYRRRTNVFDLVGDVQLGSIIFQSPRKYRSIVRRGPHGPRQPCERAAQNC